MKRSGGILKTIHFIACSCAAVALLFTGCTSNKATEWRDSKIYQGEGGAVEVVKEMEVWTKGTPNRKYKIMSMINHSHGTGGLGGLINSMSWKSGVVKKAKELGGDAVIIGSRSRILTGYTGSQSGQVNTRGPGVSYSGTSSNRANYSDKSEIFVIKFVD
jgi:hypothetical protein